MAEGFNTNIHLALVHFPVYNKFGEIVASSVTTLDVHDISRICRTFALGSFYVVTPLKAQQVLVGRLIDHWVKGFGGEYNPTRKESLLKTTVVSSLAEAVEKIEQATGQTPKTIVTGARKLEQSVGYETMRGTIKDGHHLLIFGTGWGLEKSIVRRADYALSPIDGVQEYNHLPVRAAIAIILDRLLGTGREPPGA